MDTDNEPKNGRIWAAGHEDRTTVHQLLGDRWALVPPRGYVPDGARRIATTLQGIEDGTWDAGIGIDRCMAVVNEWPDAIDANLGLAQAWKKAGSRHDTESWALEAYEIGLRAIGNQKVLLSGQNPRNVPFLQAARWAMDVLAGRDQADRALEAGALLLECDPEDSTGAGAARARIYLRTGDPESASVQIMQLKRSGSDSLYDMALAQHMLGNADAATGVLRQALTANPLIAEMLLYGSVADGPRADIPRWSEEHLRTEAEDYGDTEGGAWNAPGDAKAFLRWVSTHPVALQDQARMGDAALASDQGEPDPGVQEYDACVEGLIERMTPEASAQIAARRPDPLKRMVKRREKRKRGEEAPSGTAR